MTNKEINAEKLNVELFELENKMKKLQEFVDSDDFLSISTINQMLLANQMVGMAMYRDSLHKRIKLAENN
ncbi:crAss001_48 related protein, partial [Limosilactobacillus reuteri]